MDWAQNLLAFWFGLDEQRHWTVDPALDDEIRHRYGRLWESERHQPDARFLADPDTALAAILLFDQVPRNIFRSDRRSFATDAKALALAEILIDRGYDMIQPPERRLFLYLPFEHSEALPHQDQCVRLMETLGRPNQIDYAVKHRDVIARFGRFPHRNAVLGRESTEDEIAFGLDAAW